MAEELYLSGNEEHINKVIEFVKKKNLLGKHKIFLVDIFPELKKSYLVENGIHRGSINFIMDKLPSERTNDEHHRMIKFHKGTRNYLLSMGAFKDVDI